MAVKKKSIKNDSDIERMINESKKEARLDAIKVIYKEELKELEKLEKSLKDIFKSECEDEEKRRIYSIAHRILTKIRNSLTKGESSDELLKTSLRNTNINFESELKEKTLSKKELENMRRNQNEKPSIEMRYKKMRDFLSEFEKKIKRNYKIIPDRDEGGNVKRDNIKSVIFKDVTNKTKLKSRSTKNK